MWLEHDSLKAGAVCCCTDQLIFKDQHHWTNHYEQYHLWMLSDPVFSFRKLICFTIGDGLGAERLHNTEQWSEIKLSEIGLPLIILSELRVITKSKICPWMCVGDLTCWVRHIDSNKSTTSAESTSPLTSIWKLKSPHIQSGIFDSNNESR